MLTWPNLFTFVRALCIPLFVVMLVVWDAQIEAAWLLAALGATDWVDGYLARKLDQASAFGAVFDPTVDRVMFFVAVPLIVWVEAVPLWIAVITLLRELVVTVFAGWLWIKRNQVMRVSWAGKTGAFFLMFAYPMFLGGDTDVSYARILEIGAWILVIPGLVAGYWSIFADYSKNLPVVTDS